MWKILVGICTYRYEKNNACFLHHSLTSMLHKWKFKLHVCTLDSLSNLNIDFQSSQLKWHQVDSDMDRLLKANLLHISFKN